MISVGSAKTLVVALLVLTLLTNVTKAFLGRPANAVVDLVFVATVVLLLHLDRIRYSRLLLLFLAYVIGHAIVQMMMYGGFFGGNNYTDYRNFVRGGVIAILLLNTNFKSESEVHSFFAWVLVLCASLAAANIFTEYIAYNLLGMDLRSLPYVEVAYRSVEGGSVYGNPEARSRIPTLLGSPHFLGLTQASLTLALWYLHSRGYVSRIALIVTGLSVLLVQSRLQILVVAAVFGLYYLRGFKFTPGRLFAVVASMVAFIALAYRLREAFVLTYHVDFRFAYTVFTEYGSLDLLRELIILPSAGEMHKLFFGVGGVTGTDQYNGIISLAQVEIGLITELIPKYGLVFVALYYGLLMHIFLRLWRSRHDRLALALVPFMASAAHMWLVNTTFVTDVFFVLLAYGELVARAAEGSLVRVRAATPLSAPALA